MEYKIPKVFYSRSACIYPQYNQLKPTNPTCHESSAYPATPDSEYGWEKLFGERLYLSYLPIMRTKMRLYLQLVRITRLVLATYSIPLLNIRHLTRWRLSFSATVTKVYYHLMVTNSYRLIINYMNLYIFPSLIILVNLISLE